MPAALDKYGDQRLPPRRLTEPLQTNRSPLAPGVHSAGLMRTLCGDLKSHVPEILVEWGAITAEEPWLSLPNEHRLDTVPEVLHGVLDAALCASAAEAPEAYRRYLTAAAQHGGSRRGQGFADTLLFTEYYLLREAIRRYAEHALTAEAPTLALLRVDGALSLGARASLLGYHRAELEETGRWSEALEGVLREGEALAARGRKVT